MLKPSDLTMPAEWAKHTSVWLAWPSHAELWRENLKPAQDEFTALARAIVDLDPATGVARGESLEVLVPTPDALKAAQQALAGLPVRFHDIPFGDIWVRDTAPVFVRQKNGELLAAKFIFNSWGGKYDLPHDPEVSARVAEQTPFKAKSFPFVLEGGSVEFDGEGTCLTSKQCLLNENRNPGMSQAQVEQGLADAFGVSKVLWVTDGLINDHTDGHIDTIVRFSAPGQVLVGKSSGANDPNHEIYEELARELGEMTDASGRKLDVVRIPSPGSVLDEDGNVMPASFLNFYISNTRVIVPVYGTKYDASAVAAIGKCFPGREAIGLSAKAILSGGGAFHCISQQQPV